MKTETKIGIGIVAFILLVVVVIGVGVTNRAAAYPLTLKQAISDLDVLESRKVTLLNNLVSATNAGSEKEEEILSNIVELRASGQATSEVQAISIVAEQYPELKSIENYSQVMTEMALTENGIATQREAINAQITEYNLMFVTYPSKLFLSSDSKVNFELYSSPINGDDWSAGW